jgi:excisionase family DNA binding protein
VDAATNLLRPPQVAQYLGCSRAKAYSLIAQGDIPSVRIGRLVRVTRDDLDQFVERQRRTSPTAA